LFALSAGAFSVGVPEKFVANYRAAQGFLNRLEGLCGNRRALAAFRSSNAYASFQERWKLAVYFGLRFQVGLRSCAPASLLGRTYITSTQDCFIGPLLFCKMKRTGCVGVPRTSHVVAIKGCNWLTSSASPVMRAEHRRRAGCGHVRS
jgi:hypothetical protein